MKTPMQEFIEVLKIHRDTAFEKEKMCEAKAKSYYEGRAKAFEDAISFAEGHLKKEKEVMCESQDLAQRSDFWVEYDGAEGCFDKTFKTKEK